MKQKTAALIIIIFFLFLGLLVLYVNKQYIVLTTNTPISPFPTESMRSPSANAKRTTSQTATVIKVIDGDTVELDSGEKVRYVGIDTPEIHHPRKPVQCYGQIAAARNKDLVEGKQVRLEKDVSERDRYGRLLRFIYVMTAQGELFVNDYLVRDGYARAVTFPPDVKYSERFRLAEAEARATDKGLWKACTL